MNHGYPRKEDDAAGSSYACAWTLTAFYGDPRAKIPICTRSATQIDLKKAMINMGYSDEDSQGTKEELLVRIQTWLPSVSFSIDEKEGMQSVIAVILSAWEYNDEHKFSVSMPVKPGSSFYGCSNSLPSLRKLSGVTAFGNQGLSLNSSKAIEKIADEENEYGPPGEAFSLQDSHLTAGDWFTFLYDYEDDKQLITVRVDEISHDAPLLSESVFLKHPVRAEIISVYKILPPPQS